MRKTLLVLACTALCAGATANAVTFDATNVGTLNSLGYSLSVNVSGFRELGVIPLAPDTLDFTTYALFDLSGVSAPITGATLRLTLSDSPPKAPAVRFHSPPSAIPRNPSASSMWQLGRPT